MHPPSPSPTTAPDTAGTLGHGTMPAVCAPRYGSPDVLELRTVPIPTPGRGEVLVEVEAAGISRGSLHLFTGLPKVMRLGFGLRAPKQPVVGLEVAGTVAAVGPDVARLAVGDAVFGYAPGGTAGFAVAKEAKLALRPEGLSAIEAAVMVDSASTGFQAVDRHGHVTAGQRVLVLGASGGVGSYATQVAAARGAHVTGTASAAKAEYVRSLGAEVVVDHHAADPLEVDVPFDVIIDCGGNRPVKALRRALAGDGTLVFVGGEEGGPLTGGFERQLLAPLRAIGSRQSITSMFAVEEAATLDQLAALAAEGKVRAPIDQVHPLAGTAAAYWRMARGEIRGKDVIDLSLG